MYSVFLAAIVFLLEAQGTLIDILAVTLIFFCYTITPIFMPNKYVIKIEVGNLPLWSAKQEKHMDV